MADSSFGDMTVSALNALASSPDGVMTLPDLSAFLETRFGSTEQVAEDARSSQSRQFQADVQSLLSGSEGLVEQGYATLDNTGGLVRITAEGRAFVGR